MEMVVVRVGDQDEARPLVGLGGRRGNAAPVERRIPRAEDRIGDDAVAGNVYVYRSVAPEGDRVLPRGWVQGRVRELVNRSVRACPDPTTIRSAAASRANECVPAL